MPETGIGFFPDVGGTYFLPRCPGEVGTYLGLTGQRIGAPDCLFAGIATQFVPSERLEALEGVLSTLPSGAASGEVDTVLASFAKPAGPAPLEDIAENLDEESWPATASQPSPRPRSATPPARAPPSWNSSAAAPP